VKLMLLTIIVKVFVIFCTVRDPDPNMDSSIFKKYVCFFYDLYLRLSCFRRSTCHLEIKGFLLHFG
jgi:hypothetical protein